MVLLRLVAIAVLSHGFMHQSARRSFGMKPLHFFGISKTKITNPEEEVTDEVVMRLRVKSPDGRNTFEVGDLEFELFGKASPKAVHTFKDLVAKEKYEDKTFHRIIRGFMCQAGQGTQVEAYEDDEAGLALSFGLGALAMSNLGEPNSGNGEFFCTTARAEELDGKYVIIGRVKQKSIKTLLQVEKYGDVDGNIFNDVLIIGAQLNT